MQAKSAFIIRTDGLKSRAATEFSQAASSFKSGVWLEKGNRRVNAKSLLGILSLAISCGDEINILADGEDEEKAVDVLSDMLTESNVDS